MFQVLKSAKNSFERVFNERQKETMAAAPFAFEVKYPLEKIAKLSQAHAYLTRSPKGYS